MPKQESEPTEESEEEQEDEQEESPRASVVHSNTKPHPQIQYLNQTDFSKISSV